MSSRRAEIDRNVKLRLERDLHLSMRGTFQSVASDSTSLGFTPKVYLPEIESRLKSHYLAVADKFAGHYRRSNLVAMDPVQELMFIQDLRSQIDDRAAEQARRINRTNEKQLAEVRDSIFRKRKMLLKADPSLDLDDPILRSNIYGGFLQGRVPTISAVETQWAAEHSKFMEVAYLTGELGIVTKAALTSYKRWDTVGDDKMRDWHALADSQVVEIVGPFMVNAEKLKYPGDRSLGATNSNIINCRCSAFYRVTKKALTGARFTEPVVSGFAIRSSTKILAEVTTKSKKQIAKAKLKREIAKAKKAELAKQAKLKKALAKKKEAAKKAKAKAKKAKAKLCGCKVCQCGNCRAKRSK